MWINKRLEIDGPDPGWGWKVEAGHSGDEFGKYRSGARSDIERIARSASRAGTAGKGEE